MDFLPVQGRVFGAATGDKVRAACQDGHFLFHHWEADKLGIIISYGIWMVRQEDVIYYLRHGIHGSDGRFLGGIPAPTKSVMPCMTTYTC